eukprot:1882067-Amphidinium_carterae.1
MLNSNYLGDGTARAFKSMPTTQLLFVFVYGYVFISIFCLRWLSASGNSWETMLRLGTPIHPFLCVAPSGRCSTMDNVLLHNPQAPLEIPTAEFGICALPSSSDCVTRTPLSWVAGLEHS